MEAKPMARKSKKSPSQFTLINPNAAGIDIGASSHFIAIPADRCDRPVQEFQCFTSDLHRSANWLKAHGITTVAMESTGIYWLPLYEILEAEGLEVKLVNARQVKNLPGRKTDVLDCQWIQRLHSYGLLEGAFQPDKAIAPLRAYTRHRGNWVRYAGQHIQHMQKALRLMNLNLDVVVSDITGATGTKIIRAILVGERDPQVLAQLRDARCKKTETEIAQALDGHYRDEHLFALQQAFDAYHSYQQQIAACDQKLAACMDQLNQGTPDGRRGHALEKKPNPRRNEPDFGLQRELYCLTGVDLTKVDGIGAYTALRVLSETGTDMTRWGNAKQFCAWLGLAPGSKISGGKVLSAKTKPTANRAAAALRMAAQSLSNSKSALGAFYRRKRYHLGAPKAITATAHKLARILYALLSQGGTYEDPGEEAYEAKYQERVKQNLIRKARRLGYDLVAIETGEVASATT
jgi:transposase